MTNKLSFTFILTPLLLVIWLSGSALNAHADWKLVKDDAYRIASDGERLYAATERGIYLSRDDGITWRASNFNHPVGVLTGSPDAVYGYSWKHGLMRSVTRGNTWHPKNTGLEVRRWENGKWETRIPHIQQILVTGSGMVIAVGYHQGTWISRDRGDSWHDVTHEWTLGTGIWSMGEFDGYLWLLYSSDTAARSPDEGATWEVIPDWGHRRTIYQFSRVEAWMSFKGDLYVGGGGGFGRWREEGLEWEDLSHGLPAEPALSSLVVHGNHIFAGSFRHGVFMFDHHSETWRPAGLSDMSIPRDGLVTHRGDLFAAVAAAGHDGLYRANLRFVTPENKSAVTWGAIKVNK